MHEISLQLIFALIPTSISCYIPFCLEILLGVLRRMPAASIQWPESREECQTYNDLIIARHPRLTGAFASIDGLNLACQTSADKEIENATYNGWICKHFVSSVLVFSPKGTVIAAKLNAPDTAFPRSVKQIDGKIRAPIKSGQKMRGTADKIQERLAFDHELLSYRQSAEWGMRGLQG
ncbi:hypothetical protein C8F04DRAFT_1145714, partial [Mycena alexandri]